MKNWSEANKYTLYGVLFGICFPLSAHFLLYITQPDSTWITLIYSAHTNPLLYLIDTAPVVLGLFARIAGLRQDKINKLAEGLEDLVKAKTASLVLALEESKQANELVGHMANHDALTGLFNRRHFQEALEGWAGFATRYHRQGSLAFIDLDQFKFVNDTYGHSHGDQYLIAVGKLLVENLRTTDVIARWGGDEFIVFLPETIGSEAQLVGDKLLAAFSQTKLYFGEEPFHPAASIGISFFPDHASTANDLILFADAAMYEAKKAGRGCWRMYGASTSEVEHSQTHLHWGGRIRRALDNDQFLLLYQPVLNLKTGKTDGYEAFLRLEDVKGHLISPGQFLESAERANLSTSIDMMAMRKAARRVSHIDYIEVSINLSSKTLLDKTLIPKITEILQEFPDLSRKLRFEIADVTALQNLALVRNVAAQIKELGCKLTLDDFGLGPISMQYLEQLSVDLVKIHPSLTRTLMEQAKEINFVKNLTEMLLGYNLKICAKSIEDPLLLDKLRDIGMNYAQGFAIGKPLESLEKY
jgi:diguanylate cyclase (GGDEF)-like protein